MVNLEEIMENESRRFYESPRMTIKRINFSDIIVTSPTGNEGGVPVVTPGEEDLGELEDGGA